MPPPDAGHRPDAAVDIKLRDPQVKNNVMIRRHLRGAASDVIARARLLLQHGTRFHGQAWNR
jgi:hypothetical protein